MEINKKFKLIKFVQIKKFNKSRLLKILEIRNERNIRNNMLNNNVISRKQHIKWFRNKIVDKKNIIFYEIIFNSKLIGVISLTSIDKINKSLEWSFYITNKFQNYYGALIELKFLDYLFKKIKFINKLNCKVLGFNIAVVKLHQKFGFKIEGEIRDYLFRDKIFVNLFYLGVKKNECLEQIKIIKKKFKI